RYVKTYNENYMDIDVYEDGIYYGKCAELCCPSHSLMYFKLIVVSEEEYDQWVADMQDFDSEELDLDGAAVDGEELFDDKGCISCHATDTQNYSAGSVPQGPDLTQLG